MFLLLAAHLFIGSGLGRIRERSRRTSGDEIAFRSALRFPRGQAVTSDGREGGEYRESTGRIASGLVPRSPRLKTFGIHTLSTLLGTPVHTFIHAVISSANRVAAVQCIR